MRSRSVVRAMLLLALLSLGLAGCSLFNRAAGERQEQNEQVTSGAQIVRVVTAEGIGQGNAPVQETDTFSASQDVIYVVAEVERLEPGTTMFARWSRDGEPFEDSSEVTADRLYENTYVEFHLENLRDSMEAGQYSVQLFVNGNPVETVEFSVE